MIQLGDTTQWIQDRGDDTLRLDYDLTPDSLVWDVGAYLGDWTQAISSRYKCRVDSFEPVPDSFEALSRRVTTHVKTWCYNIGLADYTASVCISVNKDRSSTIEEKGIRVWCEMIDVFEFWRQIQSPPIDLMKINVEGGEYKIIPRMIETGMIEHVKDLQVQFHLVNTESPERYEKIAEELSKTHTCTWRYPFVWENWRLK